MLTREIAIARLRTTGTLANVPRAATAVTADQLADPAAKIVSRIMVATNSTKAPRCLAGSQNHAVLP